MSPGSTSSASPLAVARPSWIEENMPRDGSASSTGASSFRPPKRSAEPAAVTMAIARNGLDTERSQRALREHARGALALRDRAGGVVHRTRCLVDRLGDLIDGVIA